jgi:hypothetical protein
VPRNKAEQCRSSRCLQVPGQLTVTASCIVTISAESCSGLPDFYKRLVATTGSKHIVSTLPPQARPPFPDHLSFLGGTTSYTFETMASGMREMSDQSHDPNDFGSSIPAMQTIWSSFPIRRAPFTVTDHIRSLAPPEYHKLRDTFRPRNKTRHRNDDQPTHHIPLGRSVTRLPATQWQYQPHDGRRSPAGIAAGVMELLEKGVASRYLIWCTWRGGEPLRRASTDHLFQWSPPHCEIGYLSGTELSTLVNPDTTPPLTRSRDDVPELESQRGSAQQ